MRINVAFKLSLSQICTILIDKYKDADDVMLHEDGALKDTIIEYMHAHGSDFVEYLDVFWNFQMKIERRKLMKRLKGTHYERV